MSSEWPQDGQSKSTSQSETEQQAAGGPSYIQVNSKGVLRSHERVNRACDACRARKQRCQGKKPCSQCAKRGANCHFSPMKEINGRPSNVLLGRLQERIADLEAELQAYRLQSDSEDVSYLSSGVKEVCIDDGSEASTGLPVISGSQFRGERPSAGLQGSIASSSASTGFGFVGGSSEIFAAVSLGGLLEKERILPTSLTERQADYNLTQHLKTKLKPESWRPSFQVSFSGIEWPNPQLEAELVDVYFGIVHPWYPVVFEPLFRERLKKRDFLSDQNFVYIALGVFMIAAHFHPSAVAQLDTDGPLGRRCSRAGMEWWMIRARLGALETPIENSLGSIQHVLLSALFALMSFADAHFTWVLLGSAIRSLHDFGCHRERAIAMLNYTPLEVEMGRRLFWTALAFDREFHMGLGRPTMIPEGEYDTLSPKLLPDEGRLLEAWIATLPSMRMGTRRAHLSATRQMAARQKWVASLAPELLDFSSPTLSREQLLTHVRAVLIVQAGLMQLHRYDLVRCIQGEEISRKPIDESQAALRTSAEAFAALLRADAAGLVDIFTSFRAFGVIMTVCLIGHGRVAGAAAEGIDPLNLAAAETCFRVLQISASQYAIINGMEFVSSMLLKHLHMRSQSASAAFSLLGMATGQAPPPEAPQMPTLESFLESAMQDPQDSLMAFLGPNDDLFNPQDTMWLFDPQPLPTPGPAVSF